MNNQGATNLMDSAEIVRKLEQAKQAKARLEGQRDRLEADLKALGHDTIESAKTELERLQKHVSDTEPELQRKLQDFLGKHQATLATFAGTR